MEESEINLWFEENKEEMVKHYLKKMDSLLTEDQKLSAHERRLLMKRHEKRFLEDSLALRKRYESMLAKKVRKEKQKERGKRGMKKFLRPFVSTLNRLKFIFKRTKSFTGKKSEQFKRGTGFELAKKSKRSYQRFTFKVAGKLHPSRLYYQQHIWPVLHRLNAPNRALKKKLIIFWEKAKVVLSKIWSKSLDISMKVLKKIVVILKFPGKIMRKVIGKIKKTFKSIKDFMNKLIQVIKLKFSPDD
ncbi:hypothetical protein GOV09_03545 [Candidatus Woesearchaeota archaeon]|nr:hypothetical protein [Candidatus Woesearchaeota archaeon]